MTISFNYPTKHQRRRICLNSEEATEIVSLPQ